MLGGLDVSEGYLCAHRLTSLIVLYNAHDKEGVDDNREG